LFLKFCGFTRREDAEAAVRLGVDAVGLVFYQKSPRSVTPGQAAEIAASIKGKTVVIGVFVEEPEEKILEIAWQVGFGAVQLHGEEKVKNYRRLIKSDLKVIKAIHPEKPNALELALQWEKNADYFLLDAFSEKMPGGTGKRFDLKFLAPYLEIGKPVIVAGGITPQNIKEFLSLKGIFGLDVSSGIEAGPGIKSKAKMEEIIREVRAKNGYQD